MDSEHVFEGVCMCGWIWITNMCLRVCVCVFG